MGNEAVGYSPPWSLLAAPDALESLEPKRMDSGHKQWFLRARGRRTTFCDQGVRVNSDNDMTTKDDITYCNFTSITYQSAYRSALIGCMRSWLISDNDRLLEESDFVAVTVPGCSSDRQAFSLAASLALSH